MHGCTISSFPTRSNSIAVVIIIVVVVVLPVLVAVRVVEFDVVVQILFRNAGIHTLEGPAKVLVGNGRDIFGGNFHGAGAEITDGTHRGIVAESLEIGPAVAMGGGGELGDFLVSEAMGVLLEEGAKENLPIGLFWERYVQSLDETSTGGIIQLMWPIGCA